MKKILFVAILSIMYVSTIVAQEKYLGARIGYNATYFQNDGSKIGETQDNYFVSIYKDTKIIPFLFFQSGLEYTKAGGSVNQHDYAIHYLGVPLGIKAKLGPLFVTGGATFNVRISEKNNLFENSSKWYDTNVFAQAGVEILFLTLDVKYIWGLTNIQNDMTNHGVQAGIGFRF
ncbi:PorT family protein [Halosquirtibacter laminarini]|uniref:PorT family protein n=1 Tax=Halosquirtibacter laminarini TaxID=3374600 RepID=A0AC61NDX1_9BACT|nr:PorT family protein [Prolixibacteraceae bacterium]